MSFNYEEMLSLGEDLANALLSRQLTSLVVCAGGYAAKSP
jgi:hypothetical protein